MIWEALREEEFEEAIEKSGGLCVIPMGCLEKHGQHLPVGTDVYIAESVVEEAAKLEDVMILHAGPWLGEVSTFHQDADPAALTAALLIRLEKMSSQLPQRDAIMARYCRDCVTPGNQITVIRGDGKRNGTALQILPDGSLEVRYEDGTTEAVSSGEVSVRGMLGYV